MTHPSAVVAAVAAVMLFVICNFSLHKIEEGEIPFNPQWICLSTYL